MVHHRSSNYSRWYSRHDINRCNNGNESPRDDRNGMRRQHLINYRKKTTPKAALDALKSAFEDDGYSRLVGLLIKLTTTKLVDCASVEDYIDIIMKTNNQVNDVGVAM